MDKGTGLAMELARYRLKQAADCLKAAKNNMDVVQQIENAKDFMQAAMDYIDKYTEESSE